MTTQETTVGSIAENEIVNAGAVAESPEVIRAIVTVIGNETQNAVEVKEINTQENKEMNETNTINEVTSSAIMLSVKAINTASPFKDLFIIKPKDLDNIADNIKTKGYDMSKPLVLWAGHSNTLLDGHTRLQAAILAGIEQVPVMRLHFATEDEAYDYAVRCQVNRRNLTDAELFIIVSNMAGRGRGGNQSKPQCCGLPPTNAEIAQKCNTSLRKIEQIKTVKSNATPEEQQAVQDGKMSVNAANNKIKARKTVKVSSNKSKGSKAKIPSIKETAASLKKMYNAEQIKELIELLK